MSHDFAGQKCGFKDCISVPTAKHIEYTSKTSGVAQFWCKAHNPSPLPERTAHLINRDLIAALVDQRKK